jgi:hypothetical protein
MLRSLVFVVLSIPSLLFCQTGSIRGQVTDARTGEPLVGANVVIVGLKPGHGAATDVNGMFRMNKVPPSEYVVRASYIDYETVTIQNVKVTDGETKETNFTMRREGDPGPAAGNGVDSLDALGGTERKMPAESVAHETRDTLHGMDQSKK